MAATIRQGDGLAPLSWRINLEPTASVLSTGRVTREVALEGPGDQPSSRLPSRRRGRRAPIFEAVDRLPPIIPTLQSCSPSIPPGRTCARTRVRRGLVSAGAPRPRRRLKTPSTPPPRPGSSALDEKAVHRSNAFLADDSDCLRTPTPTTPSVRAPPDCTGYPPEVPRALQRDRRPHLRRPHRPDGRRPLTSRALLPRLSWNQSWCELWFTRVVSSSYGSRGCAHSRR